MLDDETRDMTLAELRKQDADRKAWQRERAPKAHVLLDRCWRLLEGSLDEDVERGIKGLVITLGPVARTGMDVDNTDYWGELEKEAEDMLRRAERAAGIQ